MGKKKTPEEIYKFHVSNLRTIDVAIKRIVLTLRDAISRDDKKTIDVFVRLYAFLLGAWIECRLKKLLFEEIGFDDNERKKIIAIESQLSQWKEVIKLAFYKHYVAAKNPPESEAKYFQELIEETRRDLKNSSYDSYTQKMRDKYQRGKL